MSKCFTLPLVFCMFFLCISADLLLAEDVDYFTTAQGILTEKGDAAYSDYLHSLNAQELLTLARQSADLSKRNEKPKTFAQVAGPVGHAVTVLGTKMNSTKFLTLAFNEMLDVQENWLVRFQFIGSLRNKDRDKEFSVVQQYAIYALISDIVADKSQDTILRVSAAMSLGQSAHNLFVIFYMLDSEYWEVRKSDPHGAAIQAAKHMPGNPFQFHLQSAISTLLKIAADTQAPPMLRQAGSEALRHPLDVCTDDKFLAELRPAIMEVVKDKSAPPDVVFPLAAYLADYYADTSTLDILIERLPDAKTPFAKNVGEQVIAKMKQIVESKSAAK